MVSSGNFGNVISLMKQEKRASAKVLIQESKNKPTPINK